MIPEYMTADGVFCSCQLSLCTLSGEQKTYQIIEGFWASTGKVKFGRAILAVDRDLQCQRRAIVHVINRLQSSPAEAFVEILQEVSHTFLGILLNSIHIEANDWPSILADECLDQVNTSLVGSNGGL